MATNGSTVFVPVVNLPVNYTSQTQSSEGGPKAPAANWSRSMSPRGR